MELKVQKRLAAQIFDCSPDRVVFAEDRLDDIKQAITKRDLRLLIGDGAITKKPTNATSKVRARKIKVQKSKGRRKGEGSRKGKFNTHFNSKKTWMNTIRVKRAFLKLLLEKKLIDRKSYRDLYLKSKGGYFRSKRHIKLYLDEHDLILNKNAKIDVEEKNESEKGKKDKVFRKKAN